MAYIRKTKDEFVVQTNYGYGWEDEVVEDTLIDAVKTKKEYIENAAHVLCGIRIRKRRVKIT